MARRTVYDPCDTIIIASGQTVHLDRRLQPEASSSWQSDKVWSRIMVQPPAGARDGRSFLLQIFAVIDEADRDRLLIEPNGLDLCCLRLYLWNEFADSRARSTGRFVLAREASNADLSKCERRPWHLLQSADALPLRSPDSAALSLLSTGTQMGDRVHFLRRRTRPRVATARSGGHDSRSEPGSSRYRDDPEGRGLDHGSLAATAAHGSHGRARQRASAARP